MTRNHEKISAKKNSIYAISLPGRAVTPSKTLQSAYYRWREESGGLPVRERGILTFIRKKNYILPNTARLRRNRG
ncbi:hypothetical protein LC613_40220 [Nostoc sphaeroides CHAB 2801]|uniref:hypothetical protein n=1 Tax=Nostoc sphaeroides TaxID=446679 RepID=UPI001E3EDA5F|nr:hypothetical protein [Nostoc sphaeroides]MCC5633662.1 hypothetical protein [Nostoc sphaeroides CHAB 2801]